jgi:hypothetical protein
MNGFRLVLYVIKYLILRSQFYRNLHVFVAMAAMEIRGFPRLIVPPISGFFGRSRYVRKNWVTLLDGRRMAFDQKMKELTFKRLVGMAKMHCAPIRTMHLL